MKIAENEYVVQECMIADSPEKIFRVDIGTGLVWVCVFHVVARNEQEAVDLVVDYMYDNDIRFYYDGDDYMKWYKETGESSDDYAESHGFTCAGNYGFYVEVVGIADETGTFEQKNYF